MQCQMPACIRTAILQCAGCRTDAGLCLRHISSGCKTCGKQKLKQQLPTAKLNAHGIEVAVETFVKQVLFDDIVDKDTHWQFGPWLQRVTCVLPEPEQTGKNRGKAAASGKAARTTKRNVKDGEWKCKVEVRKYTMKAVKDGKLVRLFELPNENLAWKHLHQAQENLGLPDRPLVSWLSWTDLYVDRDRRELDGALFLLLLIIMYLVDSVTYDERRNKWSPIPGKTERWVAFEESKQSATNLLLVLGGQADDVGIGMAKLITALFHLKPTNQELLRYKNREELKYRVCTDVARHLCVPISVNFTIWRIAPSVDIKRGEEDTFTATDYAVNAARVNPWYRANKRNLDARSFYTSPTETLFGTDAINHMYPMVSVKM